MNHQSNNREGMYKYETIDLLEDNNHTTETRGRLALAGLDTSQLVLAGITEIKISKDLAQDLQEDLFQDANSEGLFFPNVDEEQMIRALEEDEKKGFKLTIEERAKILVKNGVVGLTTKRVAFMKNKK